MDCAYCRVERAIHIDHVIPKSLRRRHGISPSDKRFHVPACGPCNWRKHTRRYYPKGFAYVELLPGKGWQEWQGGPHLEVTKYDSH